jgi:transposase InsO family protein
MPDRTPSGGTLNTTTESGCRAPPSAAIWPRPDWLPRSPRRSQRSSYIRFEADQPNECWQSDFTHYRLVTASGVPGAHVEILSWLDDHSRKALSVTAHRRITGRTVLGCFREAVASTLTDNGMVFTTRLAGGKGGRNALESELHRLGVHQKNSRPNHPTTCGKVCEHHGCAAPSRSDPGKV